MILIQLSNMQEKYMRVENYWVSEENKKDGTENWP